MTGHGHRQSPTWISKVTLCINRTSPRLYENTFALDMRNLTARSWHISEALHNNSWMLLANFPSSKSVNLMSSLTLEMMTWDWVRTHSSGILHMMVQRAVKVTLVETILGYSKYLVSSNSVQGTLHQNNFLCYASSTTWLTLRLESVQILEQKKPLFWLRCEVAAVAGGCSKGLMREFGIPQQAGSFFLWL